MDNAEGADFEKIASTLRTQIATLVCDAGSRGVALGVSGGIDSAVVCALCAGCVDTKALIMPESHATSERDTEDAVSVCKACGVPYEIIDITRAYDEIVEAYPHDISSPPLVAANIKPRVRMINLYICANAEQRLVAGTGNRTEIEIGYSTKWGDGAADFFAIGALWKTDVIALARHLGVSEAIVSKPPSAGLMPNQTDEKEIGGTYDTIDAILKRLIVDGIDEEKVSQETGESELVRSLVKRMKRNAHKAKVPPILEADL